MSATECLCLSRCWCWCCGCARLTRGKAATVKDESANRKIMCKSACMSLLESKHNTCCGACNMGGFGLGGPTNAGWGGMSMTKKKQSAQSHKPSDKGKQNRLLDARIHPKDKEQEQGASRGIWNMWHPNPCSIAVEASDDVQQKPGPLLCLARDVTLLPRACTLLCT